MVDNKRFYWLKLQKDFFSSKRIKKLRKLAGGDTYTIIYLKMQLLSLAKGGVLEYTGLEEDFASELALDLDEEPENVEVTIRYLLSCGLMEVSNENEFSLPYVVQNTGSETKWAEKKRVQRQNKECGKENLLQGTDGGHCPIEIEKEIEKEIEIEIDTDKDRVAEDNKECSLPTEGSKEISAMYYPEDEALDNEFNEYIKFRKKIKKPMTDYAIKLAMSNLKKLSGGDNDKAIEILRASIVNGWQGLYPLREENNGRRSIDWDSI